MTRRLTRGRSPNEPASICQAFMAAVCEAMQLDVEIVRQQLARTGERASKPQWLLAARVRRFASYLAHVEAGVAQKNVAAAFGLTPAAICIACRDVHDQSERDENLGFILDHALRQARAAITDDERSADELAAEKFQSALARVAWAPVIATEGNANGR